MYHRSFYLSGPSTTNRSCLLLAVLLIHADGKPARGEWRAVDAGTESKLVMLRTPVDRAIDPRAPFYVVTHGMKGVCRGDRFHSLAETISTFLPEANVLMIDWTDAARSKWLGLNLPFVVAMKVDAVADEASERLCNVGFDASNATMIGESFGNYVNAKIASNFGNVDRMLAMNPASEVGGYPVPDLRQCSRKAYSFHTYSLFDTRASLAHVSVFLETPRDATGIEQHTSGIARLTATIGEDSVGWLDANLVAFDESPERFRFRATLDGKLVEANLPRHFPITDEPCPLMIEVEGELQAPDPETEELVADKPHEDQDRGIAGNLLDGVGLAVR